MMWGTKSRKDGVCDHDRAALARPCSMGGRMQYALTAPQMRAIEERAVAEGIATLGELMGRAGAALASETLRRVPEGDVLVVCGPGNNGGDGWVAARMLQAAGRGVRVLSLVGIEALASPAAEAAGAALAAGVPWAFAGTAAVSLEGVAAIVDAMFGFGFRGAMGEPAAAVVAAIADSGAFVLSADVPSGVDADTGAVAGPAVRADVTVTFTAYKRGLLLYPGAEHAGSIVVADIGIPSRMVEAEGGLEVPRPSDFRPIFPWPGPGDHKGARGRVAVVAGSAMYSGAAVLAVSGALRMGAGYVYAVVPEPMADVVRTTLPSAIVRAVPAALDGSMARVDAVLTAVADADAIVVGPGLTTSPSVGEIVRALVRDATAPLVLDADALNVLGGDLASLDAARVPLVITPHPGEAARLLGCDIGEVVADRPGAAARLAGESRVSLLKGARTLVAGADRMAVVLAGNAGLARAGSGDVLTGMIGTLLAQRVAPFDAAVVAAHLHGRAAEFGTARLTETCFTSVDIVGFLPGAVREVRSG